MKMINRFLALAIILLFVGCAAGGAGPGSLGSGGGKGLTKEQLKKIGINENKG